MRAPWIRVTQLVFRQHVRPYGNAVLVGLFPGADDAGVDDVVVDVEFVEGVFHRGWLDWVLGLIRSEAGEISGCVDGNYQGLRFFYLV